MTQLHSNVLRSSKLELLKTELLSNWINQIIILKNETLVRFLVNKGKSSKKY